MINYFESLKGFAISNAADEEFTTYHSSQTVIVQ